MSPFFHSRHRRRIALPENGSADRPSPSEFGLADEASDPAFAPGQPAIDEWRERGLDPPDVRAIRRYRLQRIREQLRQRDLAGIVVADPLNIRYATDCTNMQVWCTHNAVRYAFVANRYSVVFHGVGLCDEYPSVYSPEDWDTAGYDGRIAENMVLCVESYIGRQGGRDGVKLEEQVLVGADGPVTLSVYPFDPLLSA